MEVWLNIMLYGLMVLAALAAALLALALLLKFLLVLPVLLVVLADLLLIGLPAYLGLEWHWSGWLIALVCWPLAA